VGRGGTYRKALGASFLATIAKLTVFRGLGQIQESSRRCSKGESQLELQVKP
jgi:hypothetical protein